MRDVGDVIIILYIIERSQKASKQTTAGYVQYMQHLGWDHYTSR